MKDAEKHDLYWRKQIGVLESIGASIADYWTFLCFPDLVHYGEDSRIPDPLHGTQKTPLANCP